MCISIAQKNFYKTMFVIFTQITRYDKFITLSMKTNKGKVDNTRNLATKWK